jgi:hypothetical protein
MTQSSAFSFGVSTADAGGAVRRRAAPRPGGCRMIRATSALVGAISFLAAAPSGARESAIAVPRGAAVTIDGRVDEPEWNGAATASDQAGATIRLRHDGRHLFLAISAARPGFASVCTSDGDTVAVRHASAALGAVTYERSGNDWVTTDKEFVYGMRATGLTKETRAERSAYLAAHGWVASTMSMGDGRAQELQIALDRLGKAPRLAVARFVLEGDGGSVAAWPAAMASEDGCRQPELVRGNVPARLRFAPERWFALEMEP